MASKPKQLCNHPGCSVLTSGRYCEQHSKVEQQRLDKTRGSAASRGYDREWQRHRLAYLAEHPWCVQCAKEGEYTPATVVDHIKPHRGNKRLFWDRSNWQSLCKRHHDQKTARGE